MSLDYAPFSESAYQELLQIHEKEDRNGYEYQLHDPEQKNRISNSSLSRLYGNVYFFYYPNTKKVSICLKLPP